MKFISKSSNLLIVLRPGLSAQPLTGTPAKSTVSVRFKDGMADVQNQDLVDMMVAHPGYNSDYIAADDVPLDPYAATRQPSEPAHTITEMKYGTPVKKETKGGSPQLPPELQKMVTGLAQEMAKQMLPSMIEHTLKNIVKSHGGNLNSVVENYKCPVDNCEFVGKNANGLRLHSKKHKTVISESIENPASRESVS